MKNIIFGLVLWTGIISFVQAQSSITYDFESPNENVPTLNPSSGFPCSASCGTGCDYDLDGTLNIVSGGGVGGSGDYLLIDQSHPVVQMPVYDPCNAYSDPAGDSELYMACWFKPDPVMRGGEIMIWRKRALLSMDETQFRALVYTQNGNIDLKFKLNGTEKASREYYSLGYWHHIAVSYENGGECVLYLDGCPVVSESAVGSGGLNENPGTDTEIQFGNPGSLGMFMGGIDAAVLSDEAQDETYIQSIISGEYPQALFNCLDCWYGELDTLEFPLGYPSQVAYDASTQMQRFPTPRYRANHGLIRNFPFVKYHELAEEIVEDGETPDRVSNSVKIQREAVMHFNYSLLLGQTHEFKSDNLDPDENPNVVDRSYEYNWVQLSKELDDVPRSIISLYKSFSPIRAWNSGWYNGNLPAILPRIATYAIRTDLGWEYYATDQNNNNEINQPFAMHQSRLNDLSTNLYSFDFKTMEGYLSELKQALLPDDTLIHFWCENGETDPNDLSSTAKHIEFDQIMNNAYPNPDYLLINGNRFLTYQGSFRDYQFNSSLVGTMFPSSHRFSFYNFGGQNEHYPIAREINTAPNGRRYPGISYYPQGQLRWRRTAAANFGIDRVAKARLIEIAEGDTFCAPFVSPGWDDGGNQILDGWMMRPGRYLGMLKILGMMGAEYFQVYQNNIKGDSTNHFYDCDTTTSRRGHEPEWNVWQLTSPGYAQATWSYVEDFFKNSNVLEGDLHLSYTSSTTNDPELAFDAGHFLKFVSARQGRVTNVNDDQFLMSGTIQRMSNAMLGGTSNNYRFEDATINLTNNIEITFPIRTQGSTYFLDRTYSLKDPSDHVIFYQLDGWHEYSHPGRWSDHFVLEAELFHSNPENVSQTHQFEIYTEQHSPTSTFDYSDFTSYVSIYDNSVTEWCEGDDAPSMTYRFTPRIEEQENLDLWLRARYPTGSDETGLLIELYPMDDPSDVQSVFINNVTTPTWTWFSLADSNGVGTFQGLNYETYEMKVTAINSEIELDQLVLLPQGESPDGVSIYADGKQTSDELSFANVVDPSCLENDGEAEVSVTGVPGPFTYLWDDGSTSSYPTNLSPGTHTVWISNGSGDCLQASVTLDKADPISFDVDQSPADCHDAADGSLEVKNVTGGNSTYSYDWSNSVTTALNANILPGTYTVTVSDGNGCETEETLRLRMNRIHEMVVWENLEYPYPSSGSSNGVITIKVNGLSGGSWANITTLCSYSISPSGSTITTLSSPKRKEFSDLDEAIYTITATRAGCSVSRDFDLDHTENFVVEPSDVNACNGAADGTITIEVIAGTSPYEHQLYAIYPGTTATCPTALQCSTGTSPTFTGLVAGIYYVYSTDDNGDEVWTTHYVDDVTNCKKGDSGQFSELTEEDWSVKCYPNPSTGEVRVTFRMWEQDSYRLEVMDLQGRVLERRESEEMVEGSQIEEVFDLNDQSEGLYMYRLQVGNRMETGRMVIQR